MTQILRKYLDGKKIDIERHFQYPENEYYVIKFKNNLPVMNYSLMIEFHSNVSSTLTGYYKSKYMYQGEKR